MQAVVHHGVGDIRLEEVPEPRIQDPADAIVGLHMVRGTLRGTQEGTVLGHEGVGVVEEAGPDARNLRTATG